MRHLEVSPYLADKKKQVRIDCRYPRRDTCEFSGCQGLDQQKDTKSTYNPLVMVHLEVGDFGHSMARLDWLEIGGW